MKAGMSTTRQDGETRDGRGVETFNFASRAQIRYR